MPFDTSRAKGTAYQTGVWVPLVVAGPMVSQPDRDVSAMVNIADLFQLFGEVAGIDVHQVVPRTIDSQPMLPYLVNPRQEEIRQTNFTQIGVNLQANGSINGPCSFTSTCSQIPVTKSVCEDNAGTWWGRGADAPITKGIPKKGLTYCCNVNQFRAKLALPPYTIQPLTSTAIRNDHFKIVTNLSQTYDRATDACVPTRDIEFYQIDESVPLPMLDESGDDLLQHPMLTRIQQENYDALSQQLTAILNSQPPCPGDGNIDGVVNSKDRSDYDYYRTLAKGFSSWFDFNLDGRTNSDDLAIIQQNQGTTCPAGSE